LNLGADWRLTDINGKFRPDARYNIQTHDGTYIFVQTEGPTLADGRSLLRARFETGTNGSYSWLNDVVAAGVLNRSGDKVFIDMWQVSTREQLRNEPPRQHVRPNQDGLIRVLDNPWQLTGHGCEGWTKE